MISSNGWAAGSIPSVLPHSCTFCAVSSTLSSKVRTRITIKRACRYAFEHLVIALARIFAFAVHCRPVTRAGAGDEQTLKVVERWHGLHPCLCEDSLTLFLRHHHIRCPFFCLCCNRHFPLPFCLICRTGASPCIQTSSNDVGSLD